jgi:hypothetical protein
MARLVYYTLALLNVSPLRIMRIIEHLTPRLIQGAFIYYLFVPSRCPYGPGDTGNCNKYDYDFQ